MADQAATYRVMRAPRDSSEHCNALAILRDPSRWTGDGWVIVRTVTGHIWFYAGEKATKHGAWGEWNGYWNFRYHVFPTREEAEAQASWYALGWEDG